MTARTGMADNILKLRALTAAGTADYTVAGVAYWTDDQLQEVLDEERTDWFRVALVAQTKVVDGTTIYKDYYMPDGCGRHWEQDTSGADYWRVADSTGAEQGTALYSVDYEGGRITFAADQGGTAYYLDGSTFDMNNAAADVWRRKAANVAEAVNWQTDGHQVDWAQEYAHCMRMAEEFEAKGGGHSVQMVRSDARRR